MATDETTIYIPTQQETDFFKEGYAAGVLAAQERAARIVDANPWKPGLAAAKIRSGQ